MLSVLSRAIEARDPYTRGHSARVTALAEEVARRLGWDEERIGLLRVLAEIREHPTLGAKILLRLVAFRGALPYVLYHHERWDGTGYPTGRSGEQIPLEARVLAVADAFDAMTSDRPYRRALSHDEALAEVARCSGTQFDPQIVEIFVELFDGSQDLPAAVAS